MNLNIPISAKKIIKFLLVIICILTSLSLLTEIISKLLDNRIFEFFSDIFNLGTERNIPTLFSVLILWFVSFLCALITFIKKEKGDRYTIHWGFLAVIFLLLGWDEGVQLHDALTNSALATNLSSIAGIKKQGVFTFNWVVIAIPIVFLLGLSYLKFVWSFPIKQRKLLIIAAITYVMGALGMEMISALIFDTIGNKQLIYMFTSTSEDALEMLGVVIFIDFLLLHLGLYIDQITINFVKGDEPLPSAHLLPSSAHLIDEKMQNYVD